MTTSFTMTIISSTVIDHTKITLYMLFMCYTMLDWRNTASVCSPSMRHIAMLEKLHYRQAGPACGAQHNTDRCFFASVLVVVHTLTATLTYHTVQLRCTIVWSLSAPHDSMPADMHEWGCVSGCLYVSINGKSADICWRCTRPSHTYRISTSALHSV